MEYRRSICLGNMNWIEFKYKFHHLINISPTKLYAGKRVICKGHFWEEINIWRLYLNERRNLFLFERKIFNQNKNKNTTACPTRLKSANLAFFQAKLKTYSITWNALLIMMVTRSNSTTTRFHMSQFAFSQYQLLHAIKIGR